MATIYAVFEGGTKDGTTGSYPGLRDDEHLYFDPAFEPHERYTPTNETRTIDGIEHRVYHLLATYA